MKVGRSKRDKQNKAPTKNTQKHTQNITPLVAAATTQLGDNNTPKEEIREKKTNPTKNFIRNPTHDPLQESHIRYRCKLRVGRGKQHIDAK
jgi:hypothetical protein